MTQNIEQNFDKIIIEDLSSPFFHGDNLAANAALQYWTSLFGVYSSLDSTVQDNVNKLAILNTMSSMINTKIQELNNPAQVSMANIANDTVPAPNVGTPALMPMNTTPETNNLEISIEDEEEVQSDELKNAGTTHPETEITGPEVVALGDPDEKANLEADADKKKIVDLTIEDKIDFGNRITSFKEWIGIESSNFVEHASTLTNESIIRIAGMNDVILRGDALIQKIIAKNELKRRSLNVDSKSKNITESTKRALEIAGILTKR